MLEGQTRNRPSALNCARTFIEMLDGEVDGGKVAVPSTDGNEEPGPDKVRLLETPDGLADHPPTTSSLESLAFLCVGCGEEIVPIGSIIRITIRMTPCPPAGAEYDQAGTYVEYIQDSVFSRAATVQRDEARHPHLYLRAAMKHGNPFFSRVYCKTCGLHVGMIIEEADGTLIYYKLIAFRGDRGWVLRLAEPGAWEAMKEDIPPSFLFKPTAPRNLESALSAPASSSHSSTPVSVVEEEIDRLRARSSAATLRIVDIFNTRELGGLVQVDSADPCDDLEVAMLAALPYGRIEIVAPRVIEEVHACGQRIVEDVSAVMTRFSEFAVIEAYPSKELFPQNAREGAALEELKWVPEVLVALSKAVRDARVDARLLLSGPGATDVRMYVLLRAFRKTSLPAPSAGPDDSVTPVLKYRGQRLRDAARTISSTPGTPPLAYVEADIVYAQTRVLSTRLPEGGKVSGVPFLLLYVTPGIDSTTVVRVLQELRQRELSGGGIDAAAAAGGMPE